MRMGGSRASPENFVRFAILPFFSASLAMGPPFGPGVYAVDRRLCTKESAAVSSPELVAAFAQDRAGLGRSTVLGCGMGVVCRCLGGVVFGGVVFGGAGVEGAGWVITGKRNPYGKQRTRRLPGFLFPCIFSMFSPILEAMF